MANDKLRVRSLDSYYSFHVLDHRWALLVWSVPRRNTFDPLRYPTVHCSGHDEFYSLAADAFLILAWATRAEPWMNISALLQTKASTRLLWLCSANCRYCREHRLLNQQWMVHRNCSRGIRCNRWYHCTEYEENSTCTSSFQADRGERVDVTWYSFSFFRIWFLSFVVSTMDLFILIEKKQIEGFPSDRDAFSSTLLRVHRSTGTRTELMFVNDHTFVCLPFLLVLATSLPVRIALDFLRLRISLLSPEVFQYLSYVRSRAVARWRVEFGRLTFVTRNQSISIHEKDIHRVFYLHRFDFVLVVHLHGFHSSCVFLLAWFRFSLDTFERFIVSSKLSTNLFPHLDLVVVNLNRCQFCLILRFLLDTQRKTATVRTTNVRQSTRQRTSLNVFEIDWYWMEKESRSNSNALIFWMKS